VGRAKKMVRAAVMNNPKLNLCISLIFIAPPIMGSLRLFTYSLALNCGLMSDLVFAPGCTLCR
jgi:hypothetical protein